MEMLITASPKRVQKDIQNLHVIQGYSSISYREGVPFFFLPSFPCPPCLL